jgi:hypothetical protein
MSNDISVFGVFSDRMSLEDAIEQLRATGFRNTDISALYSENGGVRELAHAKSTKAPEGVAAGAGAGALIGGALGWLIGIGAISIPGLGPLVVAGPIIAALAGIGVVGALGGLAGALIGMGVPEYEAKRYEGLVRNGGILLAVHTDTSEWTLLAKRLLADCGGRDIASTYEARADYPSESTNHS